MGWTTPGASLWMLRPLAGEKGASRSSLPASAEGRGAECKSWGRRGGWSVLGKPVCSVSAIVDDLHEAPCRLTWCAQTIAAKAVGVSRQESTRAWERSWVSSPP